MRTVLLTLGALCLTAATATAQVRVTMAAGQVSISAKNATIAQILGKWARVGQTRIVNAERLAGPTVTMELTDVSETQALDILLRGASGYVIAPRAVGNPSISRFDRILIVPTSTAPRAALAPAVAPTPVFQPVRPLPMLQPDADDAPAPPPGFAGPRFAAAPPPAGPGTVSPPPPSPTATPTPSSAFGVARPGMMMPSPPATPKAATDPEPR